MNRIVSTLGSVLVLSGVGILVYIGVTYAKTAPPQPSHWSAQQLAAARHLRGQLRGHQTVAVPRSLRGAATAPGAESAVRMVIPRIGVNSRVVETGTVGGVWTVADWAVGHLQSTAEPGGVGNGAYAAHDDIKGELFKRLNELTPGNTILLYTAHAVYRYVVINQQTVDPSDVAVLAPTKQPVITLISCTPYWVDTQRLVVQAQLKSSSAR